MTGCCDAHSHYVDDLKVPETRRVCVRYASNKSNSITVWRTTKPIAGPFPSKGNEKHVWVIKSKGEIIYEADVV